MSEKGITYRLLYWTVRALAALPFRALYALSDCIYILVYYVVGYRKKTVRRNLSSSFPEKSEQELRQIERRFYHWFCDYIFETMKMLDLNEKEMLEHMEFRGVDKMMECYAEGQSCAAILGHYCNWEWLSATALSYEAFTGKSKDELPAMGLIYHPLYNKAFDQLFIDIRSSKHGLCVPKKDILRYLLDFRRQGRLSLMGYIADQGPKWENIHLWLPFLNHDTPVFTGAERIIRKMNNAVFYVDMQRPYRGKYICTFQLMTREPNTLDEFGITRRFFEMLEDSIRKEPAYYLWTHKRWKRTHEEFDRRFIVENGKVIKRN